MVFLSNERRTINLMYFIFQHGTCPVCRKDLNGDDQSLKDDLPSLEDTVLGNNNSNSDLT